MSPPDNSQFIKLSVGGVVHQTTLQTLLNDEHSMLNAMFSGRWNLPKSEDGTFFIDRDGTHFAEILNHLRSSSSVLPSDSVILDKLLEEAKYYQMDPLIHRIRCHDANMRPVHIVYMRKADKKSTPFENVFELRHLKRERDSFLARTAQKLYDLGGHHSRILTIILVDLGRVRDDCSNSTISNSKSFYTPATDRTAFADFDSSIVIGRGPFDEEFTLLRRGRARELLLTSALATVFHYLRTGEFTLNFCINQFQKYLEKDYTTLTEEAASGTRSGADHEPRISWINVQNQMHSQPIIENLVLPLISDVAEYFGLRQFVELARLNSPPRPKPLLRINSV